ncbi:hypothetical protein HPB50_022663 [Hyalomma asiaticum]|uniref:Uncharacterized protein n=1 Tax=Hyalomma asiaticum TaxID=266040 RepID=A0ACB7RYJ5_HYAAI|nr:hypothetical protein HPB50_022663 [Hyalomma asiaticum]
MTAARVPAPSGCGWARDRLPTGSANGPSTDPGCGGCQGGHVRFISWSLVSCAGGHGPFQGTRGACTGCVGWLVASMVASWCGSSTHYGRFLTVLAVVDVVVA